MAEEFVVTEEHRRMLGVESAPEVFDVEKGHIKRFAEAIGDPNPFYYDLVRAKKSRYKTIIAPPTFLIDSGLMKTAERIKKIPCPLTQFLNGATEIEYFKPMKMGDTITTVAKLTDLQEKTGKSGKLLFIIVEVIYKNQKGELVAKCRETFIRR